MNELDLNPIEHNDTSENERIRADIIRNTPPGYDPLVYWHKVAMDAISTAQHDKAEMRAIRDERDRARQDFDSLTSRLATEAARQKARIPFDVSNLIDMASDGTIDLNVSLYISKGHNDI